MGEGDGDAVGHTVITTGEQLGEGLGLGEGLLVGDGLIDGEGEGDLVDDGEGLKVGDGLRVGEGDGVAVGALTIMILIVSVALSQITLAICPVWIQITPLPMNLVSEFTLTTTGLWP